VSAFLTPAELVGLLEASGFATVAVDRLTLGVVYLYVARKA